VRTSFARAAAALTLVLAFAACVSKPANGPQFYTIDPPTLRAPTAAPGAHIVSVSRVEVAPQFDRRAVTYRTGPHSFERDPYAVLAASPRDLVTAVLRATLVNADFVREVVELGGPVAPEILVEAYVSDLEGDFSVPDKPVAAVAVEMVVLVVPPMPDPVHSVLRKAYLRRLPLPEKTADAVVTAWNQGLTSILEEFQADLRAAVPPAAAASSPAR
jgi:uncharacterized lipoprotein YmbA